MIYTNASSLPSGPLQIISLVPSITELLFHLGLEDEVVGITKFCVHPNEWYVSKTRVGGTKTVNIERVRELHPSLVIANKEENEKLQVDELGNEFNVFLTDVKTLEDALLMILDIGKLVGKMKEAAIMIGSIKKEFSELQPVNPPIRSAYFIWRNPYMVAGGDTFISDMMDRCGLENSFGQANRYPEIEPGSLGKDDCQLLLLSSEPYPFAEKHITEVEKDFESIRVVLVDGEMFSWYGSRLLKAAAYFKELRDQIL